MLTVVLSIVALIIAACKLRSYSPRLWKMILLVTAALDIMTMSEVLGACV